MNKRPDYIRDTIVAPATPAGKGGVGIVRVSGPDSETIAIKMLGQLPPPRYATTSHFLDASAESIDSGIALYFPAPASFTGESVIELHGHGGPVVMNMLVETVLQLGGRRAEPGEFSQRAFLNGKLDLAQAEAIADLIDSGTTQAARAAHRSLSGTFSRAVDALTEMVIRLRMHVEAAIDFPEEEIDFLSDASLLDKLDECAREFDHLLQQAKAGRILRDGLRFVIIGRPNAGKSSLLNLLSGQDAAIVTEIAGTTRDIIREQIDVDGLQVELIDTAGLRDNPDQIEAEGIRRAKEALMAADAALWVQDATVTEGDLSSMDIPDGLPVLIVRNKIDLCTNNAQQKSSDARTINLSAKTGAGLADLCTAISAIAGHKDSGEGAFTARHRHIVALQTAHDHFNHGRTALMENRAGEILAEELRLAQKALGSISGEFSSDDLLGRIFSDFCIGK